MEIECEHMNKFLCSICNSTNAGQFFSYSLLLELPLDKKIISNVNAIQMHLLLVIFIWHFFFSLCSLFGSLLPKKSCTIFMANDFGYIHEHSAGFFFTSYFIHSYNIIKYAKYTIRIRSDIWPSDNTKYLGITRPKRTQYSSERTKNL